MKNVLTIAGSDSSGGAGIQADLKTFSAHGTFGMSVITAVTAQNTKGIIASQDILPEIISKQITAIFDDIHVDAVKIGMVSKIETIHTITDELLKYSPKNIVIDTVMISKNGFNLLKPEAKDALIKRLIPMADILTPNIPEAEEISGIKITSLEDMQKAAKIIYSMGCKNVLIKGGHLIGEAIDILYDGNVVDCFVSKRINSKNTHGTGCTLSSAIAANLALGHSVYDSIKLAKEYITIAIEHSLSIGKGVGPTNHFYSLYKMAGIIDKL